MFSEHLHKEPSEREYCKNCTLPAYSKVLDEIEEICRKTPILNKPVCSLIDSILQKIQEIKEGAQSNTDGNQPQ